MSVGLDEEQKSLLRMFANLEEAFSAGPGLLDLFSGRRGFARSFVTQGCPWALCFDLKHHFSEDLSSEQLQRSLRRALSISCFVAMAASPVCASFSTAITPPWRTSDHPAGKPGLTELQKEKILLDRQLAFVLSCVEICLTERIYFWVENPDGSWFWKQQNELSWEKAMASGRVGDWRVDQCRFGTKWRKRTRFRTNSQLQGTTNFCTCTTPHVLLRGRCAAKKQNMTKLAEAYPRRLCNFLAAAFAADCGYLGERRKLDVANCAKVSGCSGRIGEAANPGPRARRQPREGALEDFSLLEPVTIQLRAKLWSEFNCWLETEIGVGAFAAMLQCPLLVVKCLEAFGNFSFSLGTPLHYFRQLVAHIQPEYPTVLSWRKPGG